MALSSFILVIAAFCLVLLSFGVQAHTYLSNLSINGTRLPFGRCIRPLSASRRTFPVQDLSSPDLRCRTTDMSPSATDTCGILAGSTITVEWHHQGDQGEVISASHKGPCLVYMAPLESNGEGNVWFKIFEDGYDATNKQWCVDKLIKNGGKLGVVIPRDIRAGGYLLRTEIMALHNARDVGGMQDYANCAQLQVAGNGKKTPRGVAIPGVYKADDPGILINIYKKMEKYAIPGPPVLYKGE
ncbi:hypothetical protein J3B02_005853 [Coemansia erecta]|uniref:AA9 family lytic polysaccharide monooxygenase n=1 Tax=Coemansia asiatica TaxID=1052880 RepID=A0A9W7XG15_9FUNG|nr:hypothetical protein LPJ64_004498 [Coemansia asiatica]KAJ2841557.1 hypothetical protein J3B02_005853 [Coemansia erecta]KAJ2881135.1 hypothetical protein FB639_002682 [Coemansia asiatica]